METTNELELTGLREKQAWVKNYLCPALCSAECGIVNVSYPVFQCKENPRITQEYLVIEFRGGAIEARNCNWDSLSAVFEEASRLMRGGYYSEVENYKNFCEKLDWIELK